jgi:hypothetical protein
VQLVRFAAVVKPVAQVVQAWSLAAVPAVEID